MKLDSEATVRLTWLLVAFVVFGVGIGTVWLPSSQSIAQIRAHARELYEEANSNDAITRRATDLRAAQARIHADLMSLGDAHSQGAVSAAALALLDREGKGFGIDVRSVTPASSDNAHEAIAGTEMSVGLRGRFRNVLELIADVPRHDVLVEIRDAQITSNDMSPPTLDVTLHATVYRVTLQERSKANARTL